MGKYCYNNYINKELFPYHFFWSTTMLNQNTQTMPKHSDFRNMYLSTGNAITDHQFSGFIRTKGNPVVHGQVDDKGRMYLNTAEGRYYGSTLEQVIDFDLRGLKAYLDHDEVNIIKERAISGIEQLVVVLRVYKTAKDRYGEKTQKCKVHGIIVIDTKNNTILNTWHRVNHYRSFSFVEGVAQQLLQERAKRFC